LSSFEEPTTSGSTTAASSTSEYYYCQTKKSPPPAVLQGVYVHHVTKVVLKHLQQHQSSWLIQHGLDRGLQIQPNGTAVLHFPPTSSTKTTTSTSSSSIDNGRIW
jgi:hypothetical protein